MATGARHGERAVSATSDAISRLVVARERATPDAFRWGRVLLYGVVLVVAAIYLAPIAVVLVNSVRSSQDIGANGVIGLPHSFIGGNFSSAWNGYCIAEHCSGIRPYIMNSLMMAIPATILFTLLGAVCGYAISLWRFHGDT